MTRRPYAVPARGSRIPGDLGIVAPGASSTVELGFGTPAIRAGLPSTVEMAGAWTSHTDAHTPLEISHTPRDSHISTTPPWTRMQKEPDARGPRATDGHDTRDLDTA